MSSEQPLPKQSEAQDGVRWMGRQGSAGGCHVRYRRRRRQHPCGGGSGSKPWTQTPCRRRRRQHPATAAAASRGPKRRAAESRGCGRGLLAGSYGRSSVARGRRSVPPPPPRCPPGTAAAAASLGPNAVPPSPVAAAVDCGPETAAAARRHAVLFKSPSVQQRRTTLPGLGACLQGPPIAGRTPPTPNMRPGGRAARAAQAKVGRPRARGGRSVC